MSEQELTIETIDNGFLVSYQCPNSEEYRRVQVYSETIADALRDALNYFGDDSNRYSEKRTYVIEAPGDKHPDFTDAHSDVIWPDIKVSNVVES